MLGKESQMGSENYPLIAVCVKRGDRNTTPLKLQKRGNSRKLKKTRLENSAAEMEHRRQENIE